MSVGGFDFELNGVKYNAAEDAEGDHYVASREPLRPPNAVTVQGETSQRFQMRPDALKWSLTDWSGGEGQIKFNAQEPNRWKELNQVDVFKRPGTLRPGPYFEETQDSTGSADFAVPVGLVLAMSSLWAVERFNPRIYQWNASSNQWGAAVDLTSAGLTTGWHGFGKMAGDKNFLYFVEDKNPPKLWKTKGSAGTTSLITSSIPVTDQYSTLEQIGPYVYYINVLEGLVFEIAKTGGAVTEIDNFSEEPGGQGKQWSTVVGGKLYITIQYVGYSTVREITPTSAAGPAFGTEIARFPGFNARSLWSHAGILYIGGTTETTSDHVIMYVQPGGEYGTLGPVRDDYDAGDVVGQAGGSGLLDHYFGTARMNNTARRGHSIFQVDSVSGGFAGYARNEDGDDLEAPLGTAALYGTEVFFSTGPNGTDPVRVFRTDRAAYAKVSEAYSPAHDFDLAEEKVLSSLVLSTEPLPDDWLINVYYQVNGQGSYHNAMFYQTPGGTGTKVFPRFPGDVTVKFRTISILIRMTYTGAAARPTTAPIVRGVDVNAMVVKTVQTFQLLLDMADDRSRHGGTSGSVKAANLRTAASAEKIVTFKDGYETGEPGKYTEYDMVLDSYTLNNSQPGEGIARVVLREPI